MRDLILILLAALVGMGIVLWALRRWPGKPREQVPILVPDPVRQTPRPQDVTPRPGTVPADHYDDVIFGVLEFDMAPWNVEMKQPEVLIGRHSRDDVRIPDVRVSRHHARLAAKPDGGFEIENLTSERTEPNPMLVNGRQRERADIFDGDVVTLGGISFTFRRTSA